ncbi:hypothetical protein PR003_g19595 [Phytophthora rubi]|uniref:Uncharacterized protein n=1 Tax=Phytophthora rubi TaxID=129364 RepID=A0A6A3NAQ4_9STRA|nr:hypothetical protein PR002_g19083 [Phytophthora rubi]KAE9038076.1 hypothetical protein PR001_g8107 [Phytophthora rubi]KAE9313083.1 hypothetical protein PR003_g19595 [Phytophthora rubi]
MIAEPVPEESEDEIRANGRPDELDEEDEVNQAVSSDADGDARRNQLLAYLLEVRG